MIRRVTQTKQIGTRRREFTYRDGNGTTDVNDEGNPVEWNYVVIVRVKDCKDTGRTSPNGRVRYIDTSKAPQAVVLAYGGTTYGYGPWKRVVSKKGCWIDGNLATIFYRCIVYTVDNRKVYTKSLKRITPPDKFMMKFVEENTKHVLIEKVKSHE